MNENENQFKYNIDILLKSKTMDLGPIVSTIGLPPKIRWAAGDIMERPTNKHDRRQYNYCCFSIDVDYRQSIERNLDIYLDKLHLSKDYIRKLIHDDGSILIVITWYTDQGRGYEFKFPFLGKLADLQIDLGVEVFEDKSAT
jgi:hypothetical protein